MVKLVASDIDGTLLSEGQRDLNPEIYDIILELKKYHIPFVAASGRQLENMQMMFAPVADEIHYVAENGAICQYNGEKFVLSQFNRELAMRIIHELEKFPDCKITVSSPSTQYIKSGDERFYNFMTTHVRYHTTAIDSFDSITEPIIKIAFINWETHQECYEHFKSMFENEIRVAKAGNLWVDFISFESNKGTALKFILEKMGLSQDEAMAFGDQQNDIEMLEYIGKSYAMAHAKPDVKQHATDITDSVEGTLRDVLKNLK